MVNQFDLTGGLISVNNLQIASILQKNKISNTTAFVVLLEITIPDMADPIRVCYNNENIIWNNQTWIAFPFELGEVNECKSELPSLDLRISNVNKVIGGYIEKAGGGTGATVIIRVINTANLDTPEPDLEETFAVQQVTADVNNVTIKLGADAATTLRRPFWIYTCRNCRWKFKSVQCGYNGDQIACDKTLAQCKKIGNSERWGGQVGIAGKLYTN
jgi:phage-related protein